MPPVRSVFAEAVRDGHVEHDRRIVGHVADVARGGVHVHDLAVGGDAVPCDEERSVNTRAVDGLIAEPGVSAQGFKGHEFPLGKAHRRVTMRIAGKWRIMKNRM